ncbi:MAG: signal peptide peptidase SppA [Trueperaceae bacterium]
MATNGKDGSSALAGSLSTAVTTLRNGATRLRNAVVRVLPGERPEWVVLELSGPFQPRKSKRKLFSPDALMGKERTVSQEELEALVTALLEASWLKGVVVRLQDLALDWAGAYAVRRQLQRLKDGGRQLIITANSFSNTDYYVASVGDEILAPDSGEMNVNGMAITTTYKAEFLARYGLSVDKLAIREYKSAMDDFARSSMSDGQREQLTVLLDSMHEHFLEVTGQGRSKEPTEVRRWVDEGVTSATQAAEVGMIDRVAYEDEFLGKQHRPLAAAAPFLTRQVHATAPGRVALVSLEGAIIPGKSRKPPVPLPLLGDRMAGSETLVRALRTAGKDKRTKAVVFHVDSGGGSALASDLIWREIKLLAARMPVVAVMGAVAGSGGYYVLTHATKVLAAPTTITGSIGVLTAKPVMEEFNARYGFNPETLKTGRFADVYGSARPFDEEERELLTRYMDGVYDRFVTRVAEGRNLTKERVNEIGRGRLWSGADAIEVGLVDELGDVGSAVALAKRLAGLSPNAPVRSVAAPAKYVLPVGNDVQSLVSAVAPLWQERALLMMPQEFRLG